MALLRFFQSYATSRQLLMLGTAALLAATSQSGILVLVNYGVHATGWMRALLGLGFVLICLLFAGSTSLLVKGLTDVVEDALCQTRIRLSEKSCLVAVDKMEKIGITELYTPIAQSTTVLSNAAFRLSILIQAALTVLFMLVYIIYHFNAVLLIIGAAYLIALPVYRQLSLKNRLMMAEATNRQNTLFGLTKDLVAGAKEIRLRAARGEDLSQHFEEEADSLRSEAVDMHLSDQARYVFTNLTFFSLLGCVVFVLPNFANHNPDFVLDLSAALFFLLHPISQLNSGLPEYERADHAVERLTSIEARLDAALTGTLREEAAPFGPEFSELQLDQVVYQHTDAAGRPGFTLGPIDFSLRAGELVFIVGGNGSGKTTLFKLLASLYTPSSGAMRVNKVTLTAGNRQAYRDLIAAVFADFHLFKKLYGMPDVSQERVDELLQRMQLGEQTKWVQGEFTRLALSTGQRKRLALVVALLEDRPMYFFDEWAADQDPEFRRFFYEELLPELKRRGKTVLAITHDERYFHRADRVVNLEYGTIRAGAIPEGALSISGPSYLPRGG